MKLAVDPWASLMILLTVLFALPSVSSAASDPRTKLEKRMFKNAQGETLAYRLAVPPGYDAAAKYPVVLFLHGLGECGSDNESQLKHAEVLRLVSDDVAKKHPCFLVAPQCPSGYTWASLRLDRTKPYRADSQPSKPLRLVMELLDSLEKEYAIDSARRYVTGLSMGGFGSFDLCLRRPQAFAAAVPVCGGGDVSQAPQIASAAFWILHGGADGVVAPDFSRKMVAALKQAGAQVKYTEYPGVGHNSWTNAYQEPELVEWLFRQHR